MTSLTAGVYAVTVLLAAYGYKVAVGTPPPSAKTPVPDEERARNVDITFRLLDVLRKTAKLTEYVTFAVAFCETGASVIASIGEPLPHSTITHLARGLCPVDRAFNPQVQFPAWAWMGCIVMFIGSVLRIWSIRTLGRFFTYEVSIRPGHRLCTRGPYSIVRHPSYTGFILIILGQTIFAFSNGTFMQECLRWRFPIGFHITRGLILCQAGAVLHNIFIRTTREDGVLEKHFGDDWAGWAKETRYCLLPGIF